MQTSAATWYILSHFTLYHLIALTSHTPTKEMSPSRSLTWLASVYKSALLKTNVQMLTKYRFRYFHQFWRICSSLYLIRKTGWGKGCICLNTTLKKLGGLTSKINHTLIACRFLTRPAVIIRILPVPRKSAVVPEDQHPDRAPDLWKYP